MFTRKIKKFAATHCLAEWTALILTAIFIAVCVYSGIDYHSARLKTIWQFGLLVVFILGGLGTFLALVSIPAAVIEAIKTGVYINLLEDITKSICFAIMCFVPHFGVFNYYLPYIVGYLISCR